MNIEEFYQQSLECMPFSIIWVDRRGKIIDLNKKTQEIFGYSNDKLIGKAFKNLSFLPKEIFDKIDFSSKYSINLHTQPIELQLSTNHSDLKWIRIHLVLNEYGESYITQIISQDITARILAAQQFSESENKSRSVLEAIGDPLHVIDKNFQITLYNESLRHISEKLGYERELVGRNLFEIFPFLSNTIRQEYKQVFNTGLPLITFERTKICEQNYVAEVRKIPIITDGIVTHVITLVRDITERSKAEEKLKESEEKYLTLLEHEKDGVLIVQDGVFKFVNRGAADITGYSKEDLIGMPFLNVVAPEDQAFAAKRHQLRMAGSEDPQMYQLKIKCKNGTIKYMEINPNIIQFDGKPAVLGTARDITERKKMAEELEFLSNIPSQILDAIIVTNLKYEITYVNSSTEELYGYKREELLGKSPEILNAESIAGDIQQKIYETVSSGNCWIGSHLNRRKDGTTINTNHKVSPLFNKDGEIYAYIGISRNITDRKSAEVKLLESEKKYRLIAETANDLIVILDDKYRYEFINEEPHLRILGYSKEDLIGRSPLKFLEPSSIESTVEDFVKVFKTGYGMGEGYMRCKNGSYIWLEVRGRLFKDDSGKQKVLLIARDISERKALEEAKANYMYILEQEVEEKTKELKRETRELQMTLHNLKATQKKLIQSEKLASIGLLSAGIAHEINNPLMGIINYAQILINELKDIPEIVLDQKPFSFLSNIVREGSRISEIVRGLLTFAREDKGSYSLTDLSDLFNSVISLLSPKFKKYVIDIQFNLEKNLPKIPLKKPNIQQVIFNILQNATDALNEKFGECSDKGLKTISIKASIIKKDEKEYLKIAVRDNGQGIKEPILPKVLDPFFTTKPESIEHGVGLGLSITYGIIKDHGGDIEIHSEWGKYTVVNIHLPTKQSLVDD